MGEEGGNRDREEGREKGGEGERWGWREEGRERRGVDGGTEEQEKN